ncbi:E3 ubiquitin-protein ligase RNF19A [Elysia marginata]|uniref:RBR-type E3 ubiquitin transferase n=1 Tax=Elysia marginata TaxID=1093978 RepID=A0AAV4ER15_9GAST|nr:E3 ubiquitin-protein ligase RNF19A [Elysia marginata]
MEFCPNFPHYQKCTGYEKKDSDGLSASSGASRASESNKSRTSGFSLSRLLPGRRRSKSRLSLESDASRSDSGACGSQVSPPHSSGNIACGTSSPQPSLLHQQRQKNSGSLGSPAFESHGDNKSQAFSSLDGISLDQVQHHGEAGATTGAKRKRSEDLIECPVCFQEKSKDKFLEISTCHHRCCTKCLQFYFRIEIMESRPTIACPECSELYHPNDIRTIVQDDALMRKYEDFMLRRVLAMDSDTRWCPAPDCGYAVIATGCAGCPKLQCERPGCGTYFCYHCKQYWHPNQTCDAARAERLPGAVRSASLTYSQESSGAGAAQGGKDVIKSCPRCSALIVKMDDLSCNHMICAVCGANFCWLCLKEMSDLHYLSLSGCTFWGRRPWSRKKKILCQLGTLIGAPVGIPVLAGLAVPAIIIGIPIWIGQKIYFRYKLASKHKRNLATTCGVIVSLLAAPVVAGLIVGLGVPALLVYVYGVVPVSLLSASGSHMERAGVLRDDSDRDSASHRAIAGTSINGSLCSATYSAQHHKDKDGVSLCSRHFDGASVAYSEERADIECEPSVSTTTSASAISANSGKLQRTGSTSCPSSPRLSSRKGSSPAPSTEENASHGGSYRGKKCTRFMDQVSEIEVGHKASGDNRSVGSGNSNSSGGDAGTERTGSAAVGHHVSTVPRSQSAGSPAENGGLKKLPHISSVASSEEEGSAKEGLSKRSKPMTTRASSFDIPSKSLGTIKPSPSLSSTSSLSKASRHSKSSADKSEDNGVGPCSCGGSTGGRRCSGVRVKAESTSTLVDRGAESRRSEMGGGGRRKSDSTGWGLEESSDPQLRHLPPSCCAGSEQALSAVSGGPVSGRRGLLHRCAAGGGSVPGGGATQGDKSGSHIHHLSHLSQPSNLWDISELQAGMLPRLQHTTGCSDMLAVVAGPEGGASCESVFLDKMGGGGAHRLRHHCLQHQPGNKMSSCYLMSASSSGSFSSTDDQSDFIPSNSSLTSVSSRRRGADRPFDTYETLEEDDSIAKSTANNFEEKEGLPATISMSSTAAVSTPALLNAHSSKAALTCVSASEILVECLATDPHSNMACGEEKENKNRPSSKLSLQGYLPSFNDETKQRKKKSPSLATRKCMDPTDAASPESESLLEPPVPEATGNAGSVTRIKLTNQDSSTVRTTISGEVAALFDITTVPSVPSYLPDVEMPCSTERSSICRNGTSLRKQCEDSNTTLPASNAAHAPNDQTVLLPGRSTPEKLPEKVAAHLDRAVSPDTYPGAARAEVSDGLAPVLPVEEMVQVYTSNDHTEAFKFTTESKAQDFSTEQNTSEAQPKKFLNTSL